MHYYLQLSLGNELQEKLLNAFFFKYLNLAPAPLRQAQDLRHLTSSTTFTLSDDEVRVEGLRAGELYH